MEDQQQPPEIPETGPEIPDAQPPDPQIPEAEAEPSAPQHGELLPPDDIAAAGSDSALDFDDLPDPPGDGFSAGQDGGGDGTSLEAVFDVPVKVQAVLGRARMPIAELVAMRPGYVFELDRRVGEPIDILVNDRLIARGEIVMIDGALGVTLTEIVKQDA
ncbi:MAG: flagellar motor switch protein FliN [Sphingobium sp.]|nr:flagellar motor switch protein FliN [Sphingobium sp.]